MRKTPILLAILLCFSQIAAALDLEVRKQNDHLSADISADEQLCIVTYKIYYRHFGLIPIYAERSGIDIQSECEIDVPAGKSSAQFDVEDKSFRNRTLEKTLCVDVTYYEVRTRETQKLKHKNACA